MRCISPPPFLALLLTTLTLSSSSGSSISTTINNFDFELLPSESAARQTCYVLENQYRGTLSEFSLNISNGSFEDIYITLRTDGGHCLSTDPAGEDCNRIDSVRSACGQYLRNLNLSFQNSFEICFRYGFLRNHVVGVVSTTYARKGPSPRMFSKTNYSKVSPLFQPTIQAENVLQPTKQAIMSHVVVLIVNSLVDTLPNISHCDPTATSSSVCNLRSAFAYCNHTLALDLSEGCVIDIVPSSKIKLDPSLGPIQVESAIGELSVRGNACDISPLIPFSTLFLSITSDYTPIFSPVGALRFSFENCTVSNFGNENVSAIEIQKIDDVSFTAITFVSNKGNNGGAIYLNSIKSFELHSCSFLNNAAQNGGALFVSDVQVMSSIRRTTFISNIAINMGGGIFWSQDHNILLSSCQFANNTGAMGGAIIFAWNNTNITLVDLDFNRNSARAASGSGNGGALYFGNFISQVTIIRCLFSMNYGDRAGVMMFKEISQISIESCNFTQSSTAYIASVMQISGFGITISNCQFYENLESSPTSLIYLLGAIQVIIKKCTFSNNSAYIFADNSNQQILIQDSTFSLFSNLWPIYQSAVTVKGYITGVVERCIFRNGLSSGAALYVLSGGDLLVSNTHFLNNEGDWGAAVYITYSTATVLFRNCLFENNKVNIFGGAVYIGDECRLVTFQSCQFIKNVALLSGGAIYISTSGSLVVIASNFSNNTCINGNGGAIASVSRNSISIQNSMVSHNIARNGAGAFDLLDDHISIIILNNTFTTNSVLQTGAGALRIGSGNNEILIQDCLIYGNLGVSSGGIRIGSANLYVTLSGTQFIENTASYQGGGLDLDSNNNVVDISDCYFKSNVAEAGGGIYLDSDNSLITIEECSFISNTAITSGGALTLLTWNNAIITSCLFHSNFATNGGGIHLYSNNIVSFGGIEFVNNSATYKGGALYLSFQNRNIYLDDGLFHYNTAIDGGGIYVQSGNDRLTLRKSEFVENSALHDGGAIYIQDSNHEATLELSTFFRNFATHYGGGIMIQSSNYLFSVSSCIMEGNFAPSAGGCVHSSLFNENLTISDTIIIGSQSDFGGSVYIGNDHEHVHFLNISVKRSSANIGGAIYVAPFNIHVEFVNCTFVSCISSSSGAAIYSLADILLLNSCLISKTISNVLAGVYASGIATYVYDSKFSYNFGGSAGSTAALSVLDGDALEIHRCLFYSNYGYYGAGVYADYIERVSITDTQFERNNAYRGAGALVTNSGTSLLVNLFFRNNLATGLGGGLYLSTTGWSSINNSIFDDNQCNGFGGGIAGYLWIGSVTNSSFTSNSVQDSASAIWASTSFVNLFENSFVQNDARYGAGTVYWYSYTVEPTGLTDLNYFSGNVASYGENWATDGYQLFSPQDEYSITSYGQAIPFILLTMMDYYSQTVNTDSSTSIEASLSTTPTCNDQVGILSGVISVQLLLGTANFTSLEVFCAPGYNLTIFFRSTLVEKSIILHFRSCMRGEYYSARECFPCEVGTYSLKNDTSDLSTMSQISVCQPCPPHTVTCYKDVLDLEKGYWRISENTDYIQSCPYGKAACLGGERTGDESCARGYEGPLCAVCSSSYAFQSSTKTCVRCSDSAVLDISDIIFLIVLAVMGLLLLYYFSHPAIRSQIQTIDDFVIFILTKLRLVEISEHTDRCEILAYVKTLSRRLRARIRVYVTMYQILSVLPFVLDLAFPSPVSLIISALNFINISFSGSAMVTCSAHSYDFIDDLLVNTIYPIVVVAIIFCVRWSHIQVVRIRSSKNMQLVDGSQIDASALETRITNISSNYFSLFLIFTYLMLPSVSTKIFQTFRYNFKRTFSHHI